MSKRLKKSTNKPVSDAASSEANNDNTLNQDSLVNPNIGSSASHSASHGSSGNQNTNPAFGSNTPLSSQNTNMSSSNILNQPFLGYSFGNRDTQPSLYPTVPPFIITTNTSNNPITSGSSVNNGTEGSRPEVVQNPNTSSSSLQGNSSGNNPNTNSNNNPNSNNIFNLFKGGTNTSINNTINEDSRKEVRVNSSVAMDCLNMAQELVAFGFDKEVVESMNASELFLNYSDMYNQLDQVYNNESAFQKRISTLLNKYHYALDNPDDLGMFTSNSCDQISSEIIKYDFQIYNFLGRLGVAINNSFEIVERQEMQELMVLLVALRKMSLKFGAEQNNMALGSELLNGYIKGDTLETTFASKLSKLAKKNNKKKMMDTITSLAKPKFKELTTNNYNNNKNNNGNYKGIKKNPNKTKAANNNNNKYNKGSNSSQRNKNNPNNQSNSNSEQ